MQLDLANSAASAALAARSDLNRLAHSGGVDESRMAKIARTAIFEEALLNAVHAHVNELRNAAK